MGNQKILFNEVQSTGGNIASGTDGATTVTGGADDTLDSAASTFQTDGVLPGHTVTISTGAADDGTYTVKQVNSETKLTIEGTWPAGGLAAQVFSIDCYNFVGATPVGGVVDGPKHGSIITSTAKAAGLCTFQLGQPYGPEVLDWIRVERIILALDEDNITDVRLTLVPPDTGVPEVPFVRDLAEWTGAGMERILFLHGALRLRPGYQVKLTTVGAIAPQMAEVWWERERQIRTDLSTGNEVFAFGV